MKYIIKIFICITVLISYSYAQEEEYKGPTEAEWAYYQTRVRITTPPYGLDKVNRMIKTIKDKYSDDEDGGTSAITAEQYKSLSLPEKFTYVMIHPEMYSQNCDAYIPIPNEDKKIFGYLANWEGESYWSDRQINFLREKRDTVMGLIKESTLRSKKMGANYKSAVVEINAWEMIPFLIKYFKSNKKDKDALTVLFLLMKKGEYVDFMKSVSYQKLYGPDSYKYNSAIDYNDANEKLIFERAMGYYNEKINRR